ncbi:MAG TPA: hypothetical protein VLZ83_05330 [Edaphocola sp.]|nr:hypothetical protein [Edaphocola sp.]
MKKTEFFLIQLEGFFYLNYPTLLNCFQDSLETPFAFENTSLNLLYSWANGMELDTDLPLDKMAFCSFGYFLSFEEGTSYEKSFNEEDYFVNKNLFPIVASRTGDFLLVDSMKTNGKVYLYSPSLLIIEPIIVYENIERFVITMYECFSQFAYSYDNDFFLVVNDELEKAITIKLNPSSEFWD